MRRSEEPDFLRRGIPDRQVQGGASSVRPRFMLRPPSTPRPRRRYRRQPFWRGGGIAVSRLICPRQELVLTVEIEYRPLAITVQLQAARAFCEEVVMVGACAIDRVDH